MTETLNPQFNKVLHGAHGYLVGVVRGLQFWTNQKEFALRFRGDAPASTMARSMTAATVVEDYFDDAVDIGPLVAR